MAMTGTEDADYRIYTFTDLPALESEPYSREAWRFRPKLICFGQPTAYRSSQDSGPDIYWQEVAKGMQREYERDLSTGRKYRSLAAEILTNLPDDPFQKAKTIVDRLYARVLNTNAMTSEEKAARDPKDDKQAIRSEDLDESAGRRWTDGTGMYYLSYRLFSDAGLHPKVLRVANRDKRGFRFELPNVYQFDNALLGIESTDGKTMLWCDPAIRIQPFGIIDPDYQGTLALLVDPKSATAKRYRVPLQPPELSTRDFDYEVESRGSDDWFKVKARFFGFEAWAERFKFYKLTQKEAEDHLKEQLENSKRYRVTRTVLTGATEREKPLVWEAEGTRESDGGRHRKVNPFPGMDCPLWIPSIWPAHRKNPVVMAYASIGRAASRVRIPEGWKAVLQEDKQFENQFGKVFWHSQTTDDGQGRAVLVSYEVRTTKVLAGPESEGDLRSFLAAIEDGWSRKIRLEKNL